MSRVNHRTALVRISAAAIAALALSACANDATPTAVSGPQPIDKVAGTVQSLADFCKSKPKPKVPNGQLSLDAVCAPAFVAKYKGTSVKTVQPTQAPEVSILQFGTQIKVDEICSPSGFKAPMCRGFRPGDTMPAMPMSY